MKFIKRLISLFFSSPSNIDNPAEKIRPIFRTATRHRRNVRLNLDMSLRSIESAIEKLETAKKYSVIHPRLEKDITSLCTSLDNIHKIFLKKKRNIDELFMHN